MPHEGRGVAAESDHRQFVAADGEALQVSVVGQPPGQFGEHRRRRRARRAGPFQEAAALQQQLRLAEPVDFAPGLVGALGNGGLERIGRLATVVQHLCGGGDQRQHRNRGEHPVHRGPRVAKAVPLRRRQQVHA